MPSVGSSVGSSVGPCAGSCIGSSSSAVRVGHSRAITSHTFEFTEAHLVAFATLQNSGCARRNRIRRRRARARRGVASATTAGACESATVQYRIVGADGNVVGADWTSQGGFHLWDTVPGSVRSGWPGPDRRGGLQVPGVPRRIHHRGAELVRLRAPEPGRQGDGLPHRRRRRRYGRREADLAEAECEDAGLLRPDRPVRR